MDAGRVDADELLAVGREMVEWGQSQGLESRKPFEFFERLFEETSNLVQQGVDLSRAQFTAGELNALAKGQKEGEDSPDVARRYVTENIKKYQELIAENREALNTRLRDRSKRYELVIESTESQGRHKKYYYLGLKKIDQAETSESVPADPRLVEYQVRQLPKFLPWAKPFAELTLSGWRRVVFVGGLVALLMVPLSLVVFSLVSRTVFAWELIVVAVALGVLWLLKPLYDLIDSNVVRAPDWMLRLSDTDILLELRELGRDDAGLPIRQIRLVKYESVCPLCGGHLAVVAGKREFKGRMVGQCSRARAEHLYSFDHITKRGVPLRNNGYYGPVG